MPINDPEIGEFSFTRSPIHLSEAAELPKNAAPNLGSDTSWVLKNLLNYSDKKIATLKKDKIVE